MKLTDFISEVNLASQSPARLEMLRSQGLKVNAFPQDIVEVTKKTHPGEVVEDLAMQKLDSFLKSKDFDGKTTSLASDTLIYFDGRLIGKAHSSQEAYKQISDFSGNTHQVYSGYAIYYNNKIYHGWDCTDVTFRKIEEKERESYIDSLEWKGAAGSYHIQGLAKSFISNIAGDINTVIGLPLLKVSEIIVNNAL